MSRPSGDQKRAKSRKVLSCDESDEDCDDLSYDEEGKRKAAMESHCEIERRRRNKMAAYVNELCEMIPACNSSARKPDKLTILKMAVNHMSSLHGSAGSQQDVSHKPSFLSDQELKHLVLEATNGFLFVIHCETGQIIYVSDSVTPVLHQMQSDWTHHCLYDLVHPQDKEKLREHLSTSEAQIPGRILDMKTGTVKKDGHLANMKPYIGSRRAFIIRMRVGNVPIDPLFASDASRRLARSTLAPSTDGHQYAVVHVTGYVRNWPASSNGSEPSEEDNSCLVAIGRLQASAAISATDSSNNPTEFLTRHSLEGKFTFVDPSVLPLLGYQPQDLLGRSIYEFYHPDDHVQMKENFEQVLKRKGQVVAVGCRFLSKNREYVWLRTSSITFQNPYTDEVEYIICTNSCTKGSANGIASNASTQMASVMTPHQATSLNYSGVTYSDVGVMIPTRSEQYNGHKGNELDSIASAGLTPVNRLTPATNNMTPVNRLTPVNNLTPVSSLASVQPLSSNELTVDWTQTQSSYLSNQLVPDYLTVPDGHSIGSSSGTPAVGVITSNGIPFNKPEAMYTDRVGQNSLIPPASASFQPYANPTAVTTEDDNAMWSPQWNQSLLSGLAISAQNGVGMWSSQMVNASTSRHNEEQEDLSAMLRLLDSSGPDFKFSNMF